MPGVLRVRLHPITGGPLKLARRCHQTPAPPTSQEADEAEPRWPRPICHRDRDCFHSFTQLPSGLVR